MLLFAKVSSTISKDTTACGSDRNAHILANWDKLSQGSSSQRGSRSHALSISSRTRSPSPEINDAVPRIADSETNSESDSTEGSATSLPDAQALTVPHTFEDSYRYAASYIEASRAKHRPIGVRRRSIPSVPTPPPGPSDATSIHGRFINGQSDINIRERRRSQPHYDDDGEQKTFCSRDSFVIDY
jgi:hypothetical protein